MKNLYLQIYLLLLMLKKRISTQISSGPFQIALLPFLLILILLVVHIPTLEQALKGSVTRFGEISPLWREIITLWHFRKGLFSVWQHLELTLAYFRWFWANI